MSALLPPTNLASRTPRLLVVPAGTIMHRFYTQAFEPIYFDTTRGGRLNAPDASYGALYAAAAPAGAFAETFLRQPGRQQLPDDLVAAKAYVRLRPSRDLTCIQLFGRGLAPLGATAEVTHGGEPYDTPQAWSGALYGHGVTADAIAYLARHDDTEVCYAIFSRAAAAIKEVDRVEDLDNDWIWDLADEYEVGLAPR